MAKNSRIEPDRTGPPPERCPAPPSGTDPAHPTRESRCRSLLDSSPSTFLLLDRDGRVLDCNESFLRIMGTTFPEVRGRRLGEILPTTVAKVRETAVAEVFETGRLVRIEEEGSDVWSDCVVYPIAAGKVGEITGVAIQTLSLSEPAAAQRDPDQHEEYYRSLLESMDDWVWEIDLDGVHTYSNSAVTDMLGYRPDEIIDIHTTEIWCEASKTEENLEDLATQLRSGKGWKNFPARFKHRNGHAVLVESSGIPIFDPQGNLKGYRGIDRDISDRLRAEKERIELERRFLHSQKLESLSVLAGGIAHDFNNILMVILGNLDMALHELPQDSPIRPNLEDSLSASRRASDLTRQMLAYSGKGRFLVSSIQISKLVEENAKLFGSTIPRTISLQLHLGQELPAIDADPGQIQQVIMNLITNAAEAIGEGPGVISLSTRAEECDGKALEGTFTAEIPEPGLYVALEVTDTGSGMDEETRERVFEPFFTTKFEGRGLGMAGVLGIVRSHHGAILLRSAPGAGTTVRVLLPAARGRESGASLAADTRDKTKVTSNPILAGTVVLADDEPMVREIACKMLERLGFDVLCARDGKEALAMFKERPDGIACAILDLTMPRMDGITAFRQMRRVRPDLKVLLTSGYSEQETMDRYRGEGFAGFIQKPFDLRDFRDRILTVLQGE